MTIPPDIRIASLPWYDLEELRPSTDRLWRRLAGALQDRGFDGIPDSLDRQLPYEDQWRSARLLLSQACGYDVILQFRECLQVIAAPIYSAPGCSGHEHCSFVVVRDDSGFERIEDLRGRRLAINNPTSHSGMNIMRWLVAPLGGPKPFFGAVRLSGSHSNSIDMVREERADVASVDCVSYELLRRYRGDALRNTRILQTTPSVPAPPFVTSQRYAPDDVDLIHKALSEALADPDLRQDRKRLLLDGVQRVELDAYRRIAEMRYDAIRIGAAELLAGASSRR